MHVGMSLCQQPACVWQQAPALAGPALNVSCAVRLLPAGSKCVKAVLMVVCCLAGDIPEVQLVPQDVKLTVQPIVVIQVQPSQLALPVQSPCIGPVSHQLWCCVTELCG